MANASTPLGSERSSCDYQFLVEIDGETFSIKEAPAAESSFVEKEQAEYIADMDIENPTFEGTDLNFLIQFVRFAVAGDRELETPVAKQLPRLVNVILDSNDAVKKVCSKLDRVVNLLVRGMNFLLDGADDVAVHTFKRFHEEIQQIKTVCCEQNDLLEEGLNEVGDIHRLLLEVKGKRPDAVLEHAVIGLQRLQQYQFGFFRFWKNLPDAIESAAENSERWTMPMKFQAEKRMKVVCSKPYKVQVVRFYAKWVALEKTCESLHRKLKLIEEGLPASLTDTLTVHDARERAASMGEELKRGQELLHRMRENEGL
ncbi:uncharacterized protein LOC135489777 [Lineus longissimus]|uniref:uncharacterized protein LOC135489777 n=1 Tax=Lineus longissimus TaxID=88925 RepID=UPI00315C88C6